VSASPAHRRPCSPRHHPLPPIEILAACHPSLQLGHNGMVEINGLAPYPLLLLESGYSIRKLFDAACL
jgi:LysR family transcriptional regulator, nitrogen assimilation regulatory protein